MGKAHRATDLCDPEGDDLHRQIAHGSNDPPLLSRERVHRPWLHVEAVLFYSEESFEHRVIYFPEYASIKEDEELVALLRVLLSEGHIAHGTVDIDRTARLIEKSGPTGLLMTTTEAAVDAEMETRCLTIVTDDSIEQTRRVYGVLADLEDEMDTAVDFDAWHDLQEWMAGRQTRAVVPFVRALAELMPVGATRLRRDFASLLSLVRAHALLYQAQRDIDSSGRIVATVQGDYTPVRELVGDLIAQGVEASVSETIRDTVEAVRELQDDGAEQVSPKALAERLGVGRSASYDRIRRALLAGYLVNQAGKDERGMKLVIGSTLPGAEDFLPAPADVVRFMSDTATGLENDVTMHVSEQSSGRPARPGAVGNETLPSPACSVHGDARHWRSKLGIVRCAECIPPLTEQAVAEWIEVA